MGNSEILASVVPTDISDETSASFHSTPDFRNTPQTPSSHIYLEFPTTTGSADPSHLYTGPTPVITTPTAGPDFYTASHTGPSDFYNRMFRVLLSSATELHLVALYKMMMVMMVMTIMIDTH